MEERQALLPSVRTALAEAQLVVLCYPCGPTIAQARYASRQASTWLENCAVFAPGRISRSATPGLAVVAAHPHLPVGVDVEVVSAFDATGGAREEWLHPDELRALTQPFSAAVEASLWTRKEALLKAYGVGLSVSPGSILAGPHNHEWRRSDHRLLGSAMVRSLCHSTGFAIAVAVRGGQPVPVNRFEMAL